MISPSKSAILLTSAACLVMACGGSGESSDARTDLSSPGDKTVIPDSSRSMELPQLLAECSHCHVLESLGRGTDTSGSGPGAWLAEHGQGLLRFDPAFPLAGTHYYSPWPDRGHHSPADLGEAACAACHPVDENGIGHGVRMYPDNARQQVFQGGKSCGANCHEWLEEQATVAGLPGQDGPSATYEGSLRPADLLASGANAHSKLWQEGLRPQELSTRISSFNPGCGGCHNVASESHGSIPSCLDCHYLKGDGWPVHEQHVEYIGAMVETLDPESAGKTPCLYCHRQEEDESPKRANRVCHNCHLSGHQPLDGEGRAHFWPLSPDTR